MKVFISYRRDDSQIASQSIYEALMGEIGTDQVFFDIDDIPYGVNFKTHLDRVVSECGIMLVMIGPDWLHAEDAQGHRRLDDPADFVRIEVESGIERGLTVIPVLLKGARMPAANELPESLAEFTFLNAAVVDWGADLRAHRERLFKVIHRLRDGDQHDADPHRESPSRASSDGRPRGLLLAAVFAVVALAAIALWAFWNTEQPDEPSITSLDGLEVSVKAPKAERGLPAPTLNILGEQAYKAKRYNLAVARYQLAIQKKPDYTRAFGNLVLALNRQSKFESAIRLGKKGIGTASDRQDLHVAALHFQIGKAHEGRDDVDLAIKRYRLAETAARNAESSAISAAAAAERASPVAEKRGERGQEVPKSVAKARRTIKKARKYLATYRASLERLATKKPIQVQRDKLPDAAPK